MVFDAFPVDAPGTHQDVKVLHQKVEELIQKQLTTVTNNQTAPPLESRVVNAMISFTINILKILVEKSKLYIDRFMMPLVRVVQRLSREMATTTAQLSRQVGCFLLRLLVLGCLCTSSTLSFSAVLGCERASNLNFQLPANFSNASPLPTTA